jgi:hypothetical protein
MDSSAMFTGRHHWNDHKLFKVTRLFMTKYFGFVDPSEYETWAVVLLLNPAKGILESKKKDKLLQPACAELYRCLKRDGLVIFREIFQNNNRRLIAEFFQNKIIRQLWAYIRKNLTFDQCFKRSDPSENIMMTYVHITRALIESFGLDPPDWWLETFNYAKNYQLISNVPPQIVAKQTNPELWE